MNLILSIVQRVLRIVQFIKNGEGSDGAEFLRKMQITDEYRTQSFLTTHKEIAEAMGYGQSLRHFV
jgi:hypothetical protein